MSKRDRVKRLERQLEPGEKPEIEFWWVCADGLLRRFHDSANGEEEEALTPEEYDRRYPDAIKLTWGDGDDEQA